MSKKIIALLLVLCLALSLAACSSSGSGASSQTQEQSSAESSETPQENSESEEESSVPEETETTSPEETSSEEETAEVNKSGLRPAKTAEDELTEDDLQEILTYIGKAVKDEYLTPNDIDPAALVWPSDPNTFRYFDQLITNYGISTVTGESPDPVREDYVPASPDKEIMDAVYAGVINWLNEFESVDYEYLLSIMQEIDHSEYILEYIPANVTFE